MNKQELKVVLDYVQSGEPILIKFRAKDGGFIKVPIDNVEAFDDVMILNCHHPSLRLTNKEE